jgi:predicted transposase/invertase (TIGR01784 family)
MSEIDKIHDKFFKKVFSEVANVRSFLKFKLPKVLLARLDLSKLKIDRSSYVSGKYKESFSDIVAKCRTKAEDYAVDFYFLFEHKSFQDNSVHIQLLRAMAAMWQQDNEAKKPLRIIIPIVFYHGERTWTIPRQFVEQFAVSEEVKHFLLDFAYILFDTNDFDWQAKESQPLRENIFLLSAILLMKAAFQQNIEIIRQVFRLWQQIGFIREMEIIHFMMIYVMETQDIPQEHLTTMLSEEIKVKGEKIMPTLAQRLRDEGIGKGLVLGEQNSLITLLATRFRITEADKKFIQSVNDLDKLEAALKMILTAKSKGAILDYLKNS